MAKSIISSIMPVSFIIIHIGLASFVSIGPMLFLYIRKSLDPRMKVSGIESLHFIPAFLVMLFAFFGKIGQNDHLIPEQKEHLLAGVNYQSLDENQEQQEIKNKLAVHNKRCQNKNQKTLSVN
jgi:hypothetical protein